MNIDVVVTGDRQAQAMLDRLAGRLQDGTPAMVGLVDQMLEVHQERFAGRGQRWKRLDPDTVRIDRQQSRDPRPNVLTGRLMRSLTVRGAPGQVVRATSTSLFFGTNVFYARFMKRLGRNPSGVTRAQRKQLVNELRRLLIRDA